MKVFFSSYSTRNVETIPLFKGNLNLFKRYWLNGTMLALAFKTQKRMVSLTLYLPVPQWVGTNTDLPLKCNIWKIFVELCGIIGVSKIEFFNIFGNPFRLKTRFRKKWNFLHVCTLVLVIYANIKSNTASMSHWIQSVIMISIVNRCDVYFVSVSYKQKWGTLFWALLETLNVNCWTIQKGCLYVKWYVTENGQNSFLCHPYM